MRFAGTTSRYLVIGCVMAALVALAVRTGLVASRTETGLDAVRSVWQNATIGWLVGEYEPIGRREPCDQADYWLAEVERIVAAEPDSAELAMGAAWVLDSPGDEFTWRYTEEDKDLSPIAGVPIPTTDYEALGAAVGKFEIRTGRRCLELAAKATELQPRNICWWRQRALLLFHPQSHSKQYGPRQDDWLAVLDECARHDPDNALYDYLAAEYYFWVGLNFDFVDDEDVLRVKDAEAFAHGTDRFQQGLKKSKLAVGDEAIAATWTFLQGSSLPSAERADIARGRQACMRTQMLVITLSRWLNRQADAKGKDNDPAGALELLRQGPIMHEQMADDTLVAAHTTVFLGPLTWGTTAALAEEHPELVPKEELAEINGRYEAAILDSEVLSRAFQRINGRNTPPAVDFLIGLTLWAFTLSLAVALGAGGLLSWALAAWFTRNRPLWRLRLGVVRHIVAWLAGFGLAFTVFGMAPAEIISHRVQKWIAIGFGITLFAAVLAWIIRAWYVNRRLQFSLRSLLLFTAGFSVLCSLIVTLGLNDPHVLAQLPFESRVPARGWADIDAGFLSRILNADKTPWDWAFMQWGAYGGPYIGAILSLLLVAVWCWLRRGRGSKEQVEQYHAAPRRARFGAMLDCTGRSAMAVAVCLLIAHLALSPWAISVCEAQSQPKISAARDLDKWRAEFRDVVAEIKADTELMESLREEAKLRIFSERAQRPPE